MHGVTAEFIRPWPSLHVTHTSLRLQQQRRSLLGLEVRKLREIGGREIRVIYVQIITRNLSEEHLLRKQWSALSINDSDARRREGR